ncbi:hypothetical protein LOD99_11327 [Oopsacas minuta]|uniref:Uncharacterized protein n=1 Tax=Oopsacas minuta TaxID=111878 RepID=A0AAV7K4I0_9METZ|nr:hypothetical protein LOD99_11327 [Oopsacas minuta]
MFFIQKTIYYKEKKLNIGPAIRKQGGQFPKANQEFLTGQIKIFINSSHSPVYTPSSSDKISPMIYSLSPSHYMQSIPYCHHNDSPTPYFPDPTPAQTPSPLHSLQTFHFPHYPILLPPEGFFSSHDHSESPTSTWYKMAKQFPEDRRLSEKHHFTQIGK